MAIDTCETCCFGKRADNGFEWMRSCQRHAPIRDPERDRVNDWRQTVFPQVRKDDWCGDYNAQTLKDKP